METIALAIGFLQHLLPLLKYLISKRGLSPKYVEMGPDLHGMLNRCDGCLLIGDRALESAREYPN